MQRFLRGYHVRNKIMMNKRKERIWFIQLYFDELKFKLWTKTAVFIQSHVRRWLVQSGANGRKIRQVRKRNKMPKSDYKKQLETKR